MQFSARYIRKYFQTKTIRCGLQTAVAVVTIQHQFGRQRVPSEQPRHVLLDRTAVCHVADGRHNDSGVWLANEQTHRRRHVHSLRRLRRRHLTTRIRHSTLCPLFLTVRYQPSSLSSH